MTVVKLLAALVAFVFAMPAHAQTATETDEMLKLEQLWADSLLARDLETVGDLMHPEFRLMRIYGTDIYGGQKPISKEDYLGMTGMSASMIELKPLSVTYYDDVATVVLDYRIDWSGPQGPLPPRFYIVDTWVRTEDGWKILQRLSNAVPL